MGDHLAVEAAQQMNAWLDHPSISAHCFACACLDGLSWRVAEAETQFQWTDAQIEATRSLMALIPERYRMLRWGAVKPYEGRPTVEDVVAASPFESIRSAEIVGLFEQRFRMAHRRNLGGTLQHLLYNGIVHNFVPGVPESESILRAVWQVEDALIDSSLLPSDFQLLVGQRL